MNARYAVAAILLAVPGAARAADLAVLTPTGISVVADAPAATPTPIASGDFVEMAWSPDGQWLAVRDAQGNVDVVSADGTSRRGVATRSAGMAWAGSQLVALDRGRLMTADPGRVAGVIATRRSILARAGGDAVLAGATPTTATLVAPVRSPSGYGGPPVALSVDVASGHMRLVAQPGGAPFSAGNLPPEYPGLLDGRVIVDAGARAGFCAEGAMGFISPDRTRRWRMRAAFPGAARWRWTRLLSWSGGPEGIWAATTTYDERACARGLPSTSTGRIMRQAGRRMMPTSLAGTALDISPSGKRLAVVRGLVTGGATRGTADIAAGPVTTSDTAGGDARVLVESAYAVRWRPAG